MKNATRTYIPAQFSNESFLNTQIDALCEAVNKIGMQSTNAVKTVMNFMTTGFATNSSEITNYSGQASGNFNENNDDFMKNERTKEEQDVLNLTSVLWAKF